MRAAGVAARCQGSWHLCTGGWSLRGDVRGTCPRSPCTVPAMYVDVRHPRRRGSPLLRCRPLAGWSCRGLSLLSWPVIPAVVSVVVSRSRGPSCRGAAPSSWGRLLCGSSGVSRVSYEGRPRGACCRPVPGKA
jgi:hypothetical protein